MKTVLALLDFSDVTDAVVKAAGELAGTFKAAVYLLHVAAPDPDFVGYEAGPQTVRDSAAKHFREEHRHLHELEERLKKEGMDAHVLLVQGATVEKVLQEAVRLKADVVVMGSHGHGALRNVLVGSVTEGVLRRARCPVLVVPRQTA
jgi:nucleotide-binding universal stress UspA family protein